MHIAHVALQGCLRSGPIEYGLTADTGGHIRYLLDLVEALEQHEGVDRQTIFTRGFVESRLGDVYRTPREALSRRVGIVRVFGNHAGYLSKEELYRDMPALTTAFLDLIADPARRPDIIHAHYADAGTLAYAAKARYGIPFIFTPHSLGRIKRTTMGAAAASLPDLARSLARREAVEDQAIGAAAIVVVSSRDEAEGQLPTYPANQPQKVQINPPGCAFADFQQPVCGVVAGRIADRIETSLANRSLPPILAIARPVWRKNLTGLVSAYAADAWLREHANLVIFAGSSHDGAMLSDENRALIAALKELVAKHGLEGSVALPDHHHPGEVPSIYAYARERGGVFANPALHEPFGLTLIEAAAAGLPVVATDRGGPRDILADCRHGVLADPTDPAAIASALRDVLEVPARHDAYAAAGRNNVGRYTWARHAALYVRTARRLTRPVVPLLGDARFEAMLLSDIDGTLIGSEVGLARLTRWLRTHPKVLFGIATGRSLQDAIGVLTREGVAAPRVMVTSVGSEIYYTTDADFGVVADEAWAVHVGEDWEPEAVIDCLAADPRLTLQPAMEQRRFKRSWFGALTAAEVDAIEQRLADAGLAASVIYSHGRFLDVLPRRASKGTALTWLRRKFGIRRSATASAGDSGNDRELLRAAGRGIVVANHSSELECLRGEPNVVFSRAGYASGIVAGLAGWPPVIARERRGVPAAASDAPLAERV